MLGEKTQNINEIVQLFDSAVARHCARKRIPRIPVIAGSTPRGSGLLFNFASPMIVVSNRLPNRLRKYTHYQRVWYIQSALGHELKHYEQYLTLKKRKIAINREMFDEEEAYNAGYHHAETSAGEYNPEQINPLTQKRYEKFIELAWKAWDRYENEEDPNSARGDRLYLDYLNRKRVVEEMSNQFHPSLRPELPNPKQPRIFHTSCKRCGVSIVSSRWSMTHPLCQICSKCITPEEKEKILEYQAGAIVKKGRRGRRAKNPDGSSLYQSFHGVPISKQTKVYYEPPKSSDIIAIGDLSQINYRPRQTSSHHGTEFFHKAGDLGDKTIKTNAILATNKAGTQLYIVRKTRGVYPKFTSRGIIG